MGLRGEEEVRKEGILNRGGVGVRRGNVVRGDHARSRGFCMSRP